MENQATVGNVLDVYKTMDPTERQALKELKAEEEARIGKPLQLRDILLAVTPGLPQPDYLKG